MIVRTIVAFARMSGADRVVVMRAALGLLRERLRVGHPQLVAADHRGTGQVDTRRALRLAHLVRRTAESLPFASPCLDRAVVLSSLLRREALRSVVRIGVRSDRPASIDAHAWVQHGDLSLLIEDELAYLHFETPLTTDRR